MTAFRMIIFCLCLAGSFVAAEGSKPPFEWKVSGETVDEFSLELVRNHTLDQSTAEATVLTYAAYTDNRESTARMMKQVGDKWEAAVMKSLRAHEEKLLTEDARKAVEAARKEPETPVVTRTWHATEVLSSRPAGTGVTVETSQRIDEKRREVGRDTPVETTREIKRRFHCGKHGGAWRISRIEQQVRDESGRGLTWQEDSGLLVFLLYARERNGKRPAIPAIRQDTPREAAMSLFDSLLPRRDALDDGVHGTGLDAWVEVLEPLFTEQHVERQRRQVKEWIEAGPEAAAREIESVKAPEGDGVTVVRFKPVDGLSGAVELRLKRVGEVWKVHAGGFYEPAPDGKGGLTWQLTPEPDLYNLKWR
jgi:hypothetical protein